MAEDKVSGSEQLDVTLNTAEFAPGLYLVEIVGSKQEKYIKTLKLIKL